MHVAETKDQIERMQFRARMVALKLEIAGMKRRGRSAYAICKEAYGLSGSKGKVLEQMGYMLEDGMDLTPMSER